MAEVKLLSRDAILKVKDAKYQYVDVPEWGGRVKVRGLSAAQRSMVEQKYMETVMGPGGKPRTIVDPKFRGALCALCMVDEEDNRIFGDEDIDALNDKNGANVEQVFDAARKLSGMTVMSEDNSVAAAAKN